MQQWSSRAAEDLYLYLKVTLCSEISAVNPSSRCCKLLRGTIDVGRVGVLWDWQTIFSNTSSIWNNSKRHQLGKRVAILKERGNWFRNVLKSCCSIHGCCLGLQGDQTCGFSDFVSVTYTRQHCQLHPLASGIFKYRCSCTDCDEDTIRIDFDWPVKLKGKHKLFPLSDDFMQTISLLTFKGNQ